ncbi:Uncharacterized protein TCAP_03970 [Tolypocladium capitatum]|uniref:non-specific serine/threonine protein kinase n=1 Tax=Tolypocladium capitatum TaxID=45235 RepID=A0A2K3QEZ7_9HYPO|nr:Uncharacterized protein TCAP_03970 [Tolypocladium capitatum]
MRNDWRKTEKRDTSPFVFQPHLHSQCHFLLTQVVMALCRIVLRRFPHPRPSNFLPSSSASYLQHRMLMGSSWTLSGLTTKLGLFSTASPRSEPRTFPSQGFDFIDEDQPIEDEGMPEYRPEHFYPVRLGEVFNNRFQTLAKLGYGSSSTIWLTRDLQDHQYVALKIYIHNSVHHRELPFHEHLNKALPSKHMGAGNVRKLLDSFEVVGPHGKHIALALQVSQMSLRDMNTVFMKGRGFDEEFVKSAIKELLEAIDFLHTEVQAVHTDVHPGATAREFSTKRVAECLGF